MKSKYWKEPSVFPDDSARNYYYIKQYNREEVRYDRIVFDYFNKTYYRLVKLSTQFEKDDGTLKENNNWSCMIINSDFNIIYEVFFNSDDYYSYYFIPTPDGILIGNTEKTLEDKSFIHLSLISFSDK